MISPASLATLGAVRSSSIQPPAIQPVRQPAVQAQSSPRGGPPALGPPPAGGSPPPSGLPRGSLLDLSV